MLPEAKMIKGEMVLREMALSSDVKLTKKSLVRWLALSLGLISPKESRDSLLAVLEVLINAHFSGEQLNTKQIIERAGSEKPLDEKTVYYHLQRLVNSGLITREKGVYYFGDGVEKDLAKIIKNVYSQRFESAFKNIEEALESLKQK
jgi:predicted transcriptional regulator